MYRSQTVNTKKSKYIYRCMYVWCKSIIANIIKNFELTLCMLRLSAPQIDTVIRWNITGWVHVRDYPSKHETFAPQLCDDVVLTLKQHQVSVLLLNQMAVITIWLHVIYQNVIYYNTEIIPTLSRSYLEDEICTRGAILMFINSIVCQ